MNEIQSEQQAMTTSRSGVSILAVFLANCNADERDSTPPAPVLESPAITATVAPKLKPMVPEGRLIRGWQNNTFTWFSPRPEIPDPELNAEAKAVLGKHGGTLKWHHNAPYGGQWEYEPASDCGLGLDQYDTSASIAVILAGTQADDQCRICGPMRKGRWVNPKGCTEEQWQTLENRYRETLQRFGRY